MQEEFAKDLGGLPQLYNSWTGARNGFNNK